MTDPSTQAHAEPPSGFADLLAFFKAMGDETRLRIIGLLAGRERSVEELAALLDLRTPTVSHHLARLRRVGLVAMRAEGTTHYYRFVAEPLQELHRRLRPESVASLVPDPGDDPWERKVLRDFLDGERLKEIPASLKKRLVILRWLAGEFEPDRDYPEALVNEVLKRHHPDFATLRRLLVDHRFMTRDHGVYRLAERGLAPAARTR